MSKWDELTMAEKAEMMKVAVRNGITKLQDIRDKYNEFAEGGNTGVIITPDSEYNQYLNTLPDNQRLTPNDKYDSYLYWKLNGKPKNFNEALEKGMFTYDHSDNSYHANSIAWGDDEVGYFMKPKDHNTVGYETDWYNNGIVTEEGGWRRPVDYLEWLELQDFRNNYNLIDDPTRPNFYRYEPKALGGNTFKGGGYKPSASVKKRISTWEGAAMTGAKDPLSGKWGKNRSFEAEADSFYDALPASIRSQVLSNPELADNLFSYSYNVGAGNFKKRVVPALKKYYTGNGSHEEIANSMWATGDKKLRGLRNRRAVERKGVVDALTPAFVPEPVDNTFMPNPFAIQVENTYQRPIIVPDENSYVTAHKISPSEQRAQKVRESFDAINRFNALMNMLNMDTSAPTYTPDTGNPFLDAIGLLTNSNANGGKIHIKPSHKGRLTELKKRTGKTEAELYRTGSPATRKMITFARNARKWKHGLGGNLYDGTNEDSQQMKVSPYRYVLDDEGNWNKVTNDEEGRIFQGLTVTPKKTNKTFVPARIDNSSETIKRRDAFIQNRDSNGNLIGEQGLDIVSPEFDLLSLGPIWSAAGKQVVNSGKKVIDKAIANEGFAVSTPYLGNKLGRYTAWISTNRSPLKGISWMSTGKPVEEGLPLNYITSKASGEGRKLYDVGIKQAHKQGSEGLLVGDNLMSAPKSYSTYEHYYPNRVRVDDAGFWSNRNMLSNPNMRGRNVYSLEDFLKETKEHPTEKITFPGAPRYRLETPSIDNQLLNFGSVEDDTFRFTGYGEDPIQMHLKRAQAKGYDTSGIEIIDLTKNTPERERFLSLYTDKNNTKEDVLNFFLNHLDSHGHAGNVKGTSIILHNSKGANINARISHEIDHALHYPDEPIKSTILEDDIFQLRPDFAIHNNTEIAARGSQVHDYFGHTGNEPITRQQLEYIRDHYNQDTGLDNGLVQLIKKTKDLDKLAAWMTKYATVASVPITLTLTNKE